jgi:hypothetical protein
MKRTMSLVFAIVAGVAVAETPSREVCNQIFKKEKAAMNACVEKKCRGKSQERFQECHSSCAQERSDQYQGCYAAYVLGM